MVHQTLSDQTSKIKRIFTSDCEGPLSKNDNAYELTSYFVPRGDKLFALISKYDDVLADIFKRPGYKAGDTLKLILPFLKAYGATNEKMKKYSAEHVLLVPGAKDTLRFIKNMMPTFIVNTGYKHYTYALCDHLGFPYENAVGTDLDIDKYSVDEKEKERLREIATEITKMPMIQIPKNAKSIRDFSQRDQVTIGRLDEIFWKDIFQMESGRMLKEVNPIGGYEKAKAVQNIAEKLRSDQIIFVGDSITDVPVFLLVREKGGLTVSFNGNDYAVRNAEIAVLSNHTIVTSILAEVFNKYGKDQVIKLVEEWSFSALKKHGVDSLLTQRIIELYPTRLPQVEKVTSENMKRLMKESSAFRKSVRGEAIGRLG
jgi:energy-converting hydrogenase A subunit R